MSPIDEGIEFKRNMRYTGRKTRRGKRSGRRHRDDRPHGDCAILLMEDILRNENEQRCTDCTNGREMQGKRRGLRPRFHPKAPNNSSTFIIDSKGLVWDEKVGCVSGVSAQGQSPATLSTTCETVSRTISPFCYGDRSAEVLNASPTQQDVIMADLATDMAEHFNRNQSRQDCDKSSLDEIERYVFDNHDNSDDDSKSDTESCAADFSDKCSPSGTTEMHKETVDSDYDSNEDNDTYSFMLQDFESVYQNFQESDSLWCVSRRDLMDKINNLRNRVVELEYLVKRHELIIHSTTCTSMEGFSDSLPPPGHSSSQLPEDIQSMFTELDRLRLENEIERLRLAKVLVD